MIVAVECFDPELFAWGGVGEAFDGFGGELFGAFGVVDVGLGHAPVGHGAVGVEVGDVAEGAFGFVVPEAVELPDALVEISLCFFGFSGDFEVDIAGVAHEVGTLAWAFVKGFAVVGVAGEDVFFILRLGGYVFCDGGGDEEGEGEDAGEKGEDVFGSVTNE